MSHSVGTKSAKKQPASFPSEAPLAASDGNSDTNREMEQALLALENICADILEDMLPAQGSESQYWQQRLSNIATPISLALSECKGPRQFHYHYRRREDDDTVLTPVLENPLATLRQVCAEALTHCRSDMPGMHDEEIRPLRTALERALSQYIACHDEQEEADK